jgi:tripartite-type tricarboxylate transporter receptor subunit TctC
MNFSRRSLLHLAACAAAFATVPCTATAQSYPVRPITLMVGFAPGGPTDILARLMAQSLSARLRQQILVENRPGAAGNLATRTVVRAPPDGYTLLLAAPANAINATLYDTLDFNFIRDVAPVAGIVRVPSVMEVNPSLPAKSVSELIAYAKGQSRQDQDGFGRQRQPLPSVRRAVPDDDRPRHGARTLSQRT